MMNRKEFAAEMKFLPEMLAFIGGEFTACCADSRTWNLVKVACEEVLANVLSYAYGGAAGSVSVVCAFSAQSGRFTVRVADRGVSYNPLQEKLPDLDVGLDERQIGGLGVYLYKTIMDEVSYARENGENILTLVKCVAAKGVVSAHEKE